MIKACLVVEYPYTNGEIFNKSNHILNRDGCLNFFHFLKEFFYEKGVDLNTQDINCPADCRYIIYNEMPKILPSDQDIKKSYLLLFESELIRSDNWNLQAHQKFNKIFTWHDEFVDNKKYFKMNFTHSGKVDFLQFEDKARFCTLIAGNKQVHHPFELYSQRKQAIRWFENHHSDQFEFYGVGWGRYTFKGPKIIRALNRVPGLGQMLAEKWPSYKGKVDNKLFTLRDFKFSICYENAHSIPGYITEKIFDSLAAGCVPVYWGAPNILDYIPESCFVDRRKFASLDELYLYLKNMAADQYNKMLKDIEDYLQSNQHRQFTPADQASVVVTQILSHVT